MSRMITVGICSIGSGVGQSVIESCHLSRLTLRTVGLGNNPMAYGLYECDDHAFLPSYYDPRYLDQLLAVCKSEEIDVLVPGHDDEALLLAQNIETFSRIGVKVIVSSAELVRICRAKETMAGSFPEVADLFVKSLAPEVARALAASGEASFPFIAKPRDGYASKGVSIVKCAGELDRIDENAILQEVAVPHSGDPHHDTYVRALESAKNLQVAEISVQLLADVDGVIRARCATYNKLNNGVPIEVLPYENKQVQTAVSRLIPFLQEKGLRGPINIQGRLTDRGFRIFELNPRFTGITGLRAAMGFNEVAACIRHWGTGMPMEALSLNPRLFGIRQTANRTVHLCRNHRVEQLHRDVHGQAGCNDDKPVILVTGSTGTIGRALMEALLRQGEFDVWTLNRSKQVAEKLHPEASRAYDWSDFDSGVLNLGGVDKIVHLASARPFHQPREIADSLAKGMQLFTGFAEHGAGEIIYASSQSVYGSQHGVPWTEDLTPQPETLYGQLKYALELHLASLRKMKPSLSTVALRIGTVTGDDPTVNQHEALARLTRRAVDERTVQMQGGDQLLGRVHYLDVVDGILCAIRRRSYSSHDVYNLGMEKAHTLAEMVDQIVKVVECRSPGMPVIVTTSPATGEKPRSQAIDSSRFMEAFGWKPKYSLETIIESFVRTSHEPGNAKPSSQA